MVNQLCSNMQDILVVAVNSISSGNSEGPNASYSFTTRPKIPFFLFVTYFRLSNWNILLGHTL